MRSAHYHSVCLINHGIRMMLVGAICLGIALSSVVNIMQLATGAGALQFSDSIRPTPATLAKLMPVTFTTKENTPNLTVIGRLVDSIRPKPNQNLRYTIPQNPYFDISPESSVRVIGLLDRDENRQLCTEPSYPQQCVWTSFVVTGNGQYIGLRVVINDVNDNVPAWAESSITIHVTEEMQTTFSAELPVAKDPDLDKNGIQGYKLQTELEDAERFELIVKSSAVKSGVRFSIDSAETLSSRFKLFLQVLKPLDRETQPRHNLTLLAFDGSEPYHTGRLNIIVEVVDENDHSPQFTSSAYTAVVSEDASVGSDIPLQESTSVAVKQSDSGGFVPPSYVDRVSQMRATDRDEGPNGQIQYEFAASTDPQVLDLFTLDQYSGRIRVAKPLSYDIRPTGWKFQVLAKDGGRPSRSSSTTVVIQLKDANTHGPEIKTRLHEPKPFFEGITRLGIPSAPAEHITNVIYIPENTPPVLEPLAVFTVGDKDTGTGGEFDCVLTDSEMSASNHADGSADFCLNFTAKLPNWNVYSLYVIRSIDREAAPVRELVVTCTDHGEPPRSTYEKLNVILVDENDNAPQFTQKTYQFHVLEGNRPNASVGKLRAHDPDDGPNGRVTYRIVWPPTQPISDRPFLIAEGGKLIVTKTLDREANPKGYKFQVIAADGGKPRPLNDTAEVEVILDDINDCTPQFSQKHYNFTIEEDYAQNFTIGRLVGRVQAVDCDLGLNGAVQYVILDPGLPFEITSNGMLKTTRYIDREMRAVYSLTVLARDGGNEGDADLDEELQEYRTAGSTDMFNRAINDQKVRTSAAQVQITVTDVNDHYPIFVYPNASSYQVRISMHEKRGFIITRLVAVDKDTGPNGQIRYGIIKGNQLGLFKVRPDTGELYLDRPLSAEYKGNLVLIVEASDLGTPKPQTNSLEIRLIITDEPAVGRKMNMWDTTMDGKYSPFDMLPMDGGDGDSTGAIELNKLIMMCIVISTAVVCLIMIFAIAIFVRRTSCNSMCVSARRNQRSRGHSANGTTATMNAERYTNPWETDSDGKPDGFEMSRDSRLGTLNDQSRRKSERDDGLDLRKPTVSLDFVASSKVPLLYDSVAGAKNGNVISYSLDERTITNRYVDLSSQSPGKVTFNAVPSPDTQGFHLEQNEAAGEKRQYVLSQHTGMRLFRPGDTTLCAIHEDATAGIQLVAIPVVSSDGSYVPLAHHHAPCSLAEQMDSCAPNPTCSSHVNQSQPGSAGFDPISLDSDADSGRGGSVNNIGLTYSLEGSVCPITETITMTGTTSATVHTLGIPVRYVSYPAEGKMHMLSSPNSCALGPQAVLLPISAVPPDPTTLTMKPDPSNTTDMNDSSYAIPSCGVHSVSPVMPNIPTTVLSASTTSPSKRQDSAGGKKRDCGPWRLVQLPTQELEAEIQKY